MRPLYSICSAISLRKQEEFHRRATGRLGHNRETQPHGADAILAQICSGNLGHLFSTDRLIGGNDFVRVYSS